MKALVGTCNKEKALVGAFSVNVKTDGSFAALVSISRLSLVLPSLAREIFHTRDTIAATTEEVKICSLQTWKRCLIIKR